MDASSTVWIIAIVALIVGALIGYLLGRSGGNDSRQLELIEQLDETQQELAAYKAKVTAHFEETAHLVGGLTQSYKAVHQHLAKSSADLCDSEQVSRALEEALQPRLTDESEGEEAEKPVNEAKKATAKEKTKTKPAPKDDDAVAAPLDYAPKKADEEGMLSETYGLKAGEEEEQVKDPVDFASEKKSPVKKPKAAKQD